MKHLMRRSAYITAFVAIFTVAHGCAVAAAAEKPDTLKIGISAFLSGPASVFGVPAKAAAEMMAERINNNGGIHGVPVSLKFIDEGAGSEHLLTEYRRLVESQGFDVMFASISSGNCLKVAPLAEDLKVINFAWDCGTQRLFEDADYDYVFRTQGYGTSEMLSTVLYLLRAKPDFKTIAVVNQDYAWGRDSWDLFRTALKALKPDVKVVAELFPKFGTADYSTIVTRLLALRPDVVLSTSWGGDLDNFVRQAAQRGLAQRSTLVLPLAESSLERLGKDLPAGAIIGARGDHYYKDPKYVGQPRFDRFVAAYQKRTGQVPIYSVFHMAQAFAALKAGYAKAIAANDGQWPTTKQLAAALEGLTFRGLTNPVTLRSDHQGIEDMLYGTSVRVSGQKIAGLSNIMIFPGEALMPPVGQKSLPWLKTISKEQFKDMKVATYPGAR